MFTSLHRIQQNIVSLLTDSKNYSQVQQEVANLFDNALLQSVNEIFTTVHPGQEVLVIDHLQIDLGNIPHSMLRDEFPRRLLQQLKRELERYAAGRTDHLISEQTDRFNSLTYFLLRGYLPWQVKRLAAKGVEELFRNCIVQYPGQLKQFLLSNANNHTCIRRIVGQFSKELIHELIKLLQPTEAGFIIAYLEEVKTAQRKASDTTTRPDEKVCIRVVLTYLLNERGSYFNRKEFLKTTLQQLAIEQNVSFHSLLQWLKAHLDMVISEHPQKSRFSHIIQEIVHEVLKTTTTVNDTQIAAPTVDTMPATIFNGIIQVSGTDCLLDLRHHPIALQQLKYNPGKFWQSFNAHLYTNYKLNTDSLSTLIVYPMEVSLNTPVSATVNTRTGWWLASYYLLHGSLPVSFRHFSRNTIKHLFSLFLQQASTTKQLVGLVAKSVDTESSHQELFTRFAALYHFHTISIAETLQQLLSLQKKGLIPVQYPAYLKHFIIAVTLRYITQTKPPFSKEHFIQHLQTSVAREFGIPLQQLIQVMSVMPTKLPHSFNSNLRLSFASPLTNYPGFYYNNVDISGLSGKNLQFRAGTLQFSPSVIHTYNRQTTAAVIHFLLTGQISWWSPWTEHQLPSIILFLATQKDRTFLQALLQYRHKKSFLQNLLYLFPDKPASFLIHVITGITPEQQQRLLKAHDYLYQYFRNTTVRPSESADWFLHTTLTAITTRKRWRISFEELLPFWTSHLLPGSKQAVSALQKLAHFRAGHLPDTAVAVELFSEKELSLQLQLLLKNAQKQSATDIVAMYITNTSSHIYKLAAAKLYSDNTRQQDLKFLEIALQQYPHYRDILLPVFHQLQVTTTPSANWFITHLATLASKNKTLAAEILRHLLINKSRWSLQWTNIPLTDLIRVVHILLKENAETTSLITTLENAWSSAPANKPAKSRLFWRITVDVLLQQSAFNQVYFTKNWLLKMSGVMGMRLHSLITGLLEQLHYDYNDPAKKYLMHVLHTLAEDKKFLSGSYRKVPATTASKIIEKHTSTKKQLAATMQLPTAFSLKEGECTYINNSGLALITPFVKMLFERLGYTTEGVFNDEDTTARAIHLLQFIATGFENVEEHYLFFNKVLCGLDPLLPIDKEIALTEDEKEIAESLLQSVISNWPPVKTMSLDALRGNFLLREGKLQKDAQSWKLTIEKKPYDILLQQIPWSFSTIKFTWMPEPVFVQWI